VAGGFIWAEAEGAVLAAYVLVAMVEAAVAVGVFTVHGPAKMDVTVVVVVVVPGLLQAVVVVRRGLYMAVQAVAAAGLAVVEHIVHPEDLEDPVQMAVKTAVMEYFVAMAVLAVNMAGAGAGRDLAMAVLAVME